ncbi:hypothetical protein ACFLZP_05030 [Patescibacteria group bacterium]
MFASANSIGFSRSRAIIPDFFRNYNLAFLICLGKYSYFHTSNTLLHYGENVKALRHPASFEPGVMALSSQFSRLPHIKPFAGFCYSAIVFLGLGQA